ncbi:MATE family efflux transporter [Confluentibacter sediminis]|uniref:MATE family efflux transporter n=1 Tax=Confluentibacter sediminis TaxID=2219045 RepID=UPI000DACB29B|nr:MATE family efflux transporter [Confluentibacter sediminis]
MTTSESNKRIAKNTALLYVRMLFTMSIGFYTSRIILDALGVVNYGIYNVVGGIVTTLSVLNGSMAGATQRWITVALGEGNVDNLKKVFSIGVSAQVIIATIVLVIIETAGLWYLFNYAVIPPDRFNASFWVFQISAITMVLEIINVPFTGAIMAHEKMGAFAMISIIEVVMKLLICYLLYITLLDKLIVYAVLLFITYLIIFLIQKIYCYRNFIEARFTLGWDKKILKDMWSLAFWSMSGNIAYVGYTQGITLLINLFFGPAMNAAMAVANQAGNIINQFSSNFQTAMNPQITKNYAKGNLKDMHDLVFRSAKFSYFLMLIFVVPLFFEAPLLIGIWLKEVPDHTVNFLRIGLFVSMLMAVRNPLIVSAQAYGDLRKYQFVVIPILLMVCPISYVFLKLGGFPEITSLVMLCIMIIAVFASAYMLRDMVSLNFKDFVEKVIFKVLIVTILSFIPPAVVYVMLEEGILRFLILGALSLVTSLISIYKVGLTTSEQIFVVSMIKTKITKKLYKPNE